MSQKPHILLTGLPGVGKTTLLRHVAEELGHRAAGFYTLEVRNVAGQRTGFEIVTLDGRRRLLSSVTIRSPYRVSKYGVDIDAIDDLAVDSIRRGLADQEVSFILIDEIARMELCSETFVRTVQEAFDSGKRLIAAIQKGRHPFIEQIRSRADVELFNLTPTNRNHIRDVILQRLADPSDPSRRNPGVRRPI